MSLPLQGLPVEDEPVPGLPRHLPPGGQAFSHGGQAGGQLLPLLPEGVAEAASYRGAHTHAVIAGCSAGDLKQDKYQFLS